MSFSAAGSLLFSPFSIRGLRFARGEPCVCGSMVLCPEAGGPWVHIDSARGVSRRFDLPSALGGTPYRCQVVAYDPAGNRSKALGPVTIPLEASHG